MIKQFRYYETCSFKYTVITYHDGVEQSCESMWKTELDDYLDRLYDEGYTYGYTDKEVEDAYKRYRKIKELQLVNPNAIKNPCNGCIHWNDGDCSNSLDTNTYETEEDRFLANCAGCCCGDGCECNKGSRCENYETEEDD